MGINLPSNPVEKLLTVFNNQAEIAAFCFVSRSAITRWKEDGKIPPWHINALSRYTSIPEWEICPTHFKKPEDADGRDTTA